VQQVRKATGEALAQIRAEAANPKTDLWWGGTGDPYLQAAEVGLLEAYRPPISTTCTAGRCGNTR
jgi:iron(III) transport system substrate-binding protein